MEGAPTLPPEVCKLPRPAQKNSLHTESAAPLTYLSGGKQMVRIAAGDALYSFGLEE